MEYSMLFAKYKSKTNAKLVSSMKAKVTATATVLPKTPMLPFYLSCPTLWVLTSFLDEACLFPHPQHHL